MRTLHKPKALRPGQTIGLVAPSGPLWDPEKLPQTVQYLERLGYRVRVYDSCTSRDGYLAGPDALRADDLNRAFADDGVDAVFCVRGGYGATRLLGMLDYAVIRANPKVFTGFSDITALHSAFHVHACFVTFHGLMCGDFADAANLPYNIAHFWRAVGDQSPLGMLENPCDDPRETIAPGVAEGPLLGGNLSLVASVLGTPYADDYEGAIVFLEEVGEKRYAVDRMLTQLRNAGVFDRCAGVLLGAYTEVTSDRPESDFTLERIFRDLLGDLGKPVLSGLRCGHCTDKLTLPLGTRCRVDAAAQTVEILEGAVR